MPGSIELSSKTNPFRARRFAKQDLVECLATCPARIGQEFIGYLRAFSAWQALIESVAFRCTVIEAAEPICGHKIMGFGACVFVTPEFANRQLSHPAPGLNERIISSVACGRPVVLSEEELRRHNSDDGVSMVVLFSNWRSGIGLSAEQIDEVKLELAKSGVERLSGYRLERMLMEALDRTDREYFEATGVWRFVSNFADYHAANPGSIWGCDRMLATIDKESALSIVGSVAGLVFRYEPPILRFSHGDQQLVTAALEGLTDLELARELGWKPETIKKRWASVFARVADVMPGLLPESENGSESQRRGPQKRHHLLAYLRHHPEELRPFLR